MILGVDHIALSCPDIDEGVAGLSRWGATASFVHRGLPNDPEKRAFLSRYEPEHDIAYCRGVDGVAIELTVHAAPLTPGPSPYQVLLTGPDGGVGAYSDTLPAGWDDLLAPARPGCWPQLDAQLWYAPDADTTPAVRTVLIPVPDPATSARFWIDGLGAEPVAGPDEHDVGSRRLHIGSPVPAWSLEIVLASGGPVMDPPQLDQAGFTCLALLTNRIDADLERATASGATSVGDVFAAQVGGRALRVALLRGAGDELIELIEVQR